MKRLLLVASLILAAGWCRAAAIPSLVYQTGISSITTAIVNVSTASTPGATQVDNPQVPGRVALEIQNIDATANLWCLPVSTKPVVNGGRKIPAGSSWAVSVLDTIVRPGQPQSTTGVKFWCLSDGAASTKACVTQLY